MNDALKILVVDDEPGMREGVARALRGFVVRIPEINGDVAVTVEQAESGEQALEMIAAAPPDILLLDHKLPGITGLDVLERLASILPAGGEAFKDRMLTIMITAYASLETAVAAIKSGAYDFLAKPFTPSELKNIVRKAAESLLLTRHARQLAAEKKQVRFQFISVLAHELKAPLAAIEGYLRIIRDRSAGDDAATYDHMIDRSLVRLEGMRKLIVDLLDLTRIESGQKTRELAQVDLAEAARQVLEGYRSPAKQRGIAVELHVQGDAKLQADRGEMEMILDNLVSNAIKYNRDGGRVDVTLGGDAERATIAVTDTGFGMTPEESGRLFHDFVRIKNDNTRNILGSGLGLSIVRKVALLYGGQAMVSSQAGAGSTFTVTLNRKQAQ